MAKNVKNHEAIAGLAVSIRLLARALKQLLPSATADETQERIEKFLRPCDTLKDEEKD